MEEAWMKECFKFQMSGSTLGGFALSPLFQKWKVYGYLYITYYFINIFDKSVQLLIIN